MAIQIYNTLTRKKEELIPIEAGKVRMYLCGPTVYDYFHIGNARPFILFDIFRRYLKYRGLDVKFVMNLTDIDDKIIQKSMEENIPASDVAAKYSEAFFEDIKKLGIEAADVYPKATENISEIINLIEKLIEKGIAYDIDGDVFYSVKDFPEYGKLSGKKIDDLRSGARVEIDQRKRNPLDFSLWKAAKQGEPSWDSPWGKGRPGWHIECSVMAMKYLGESIDIHAGGSDLIFPHHENEIAQTRGSSNSKLANYFVHNNHILVDGKKMSKSLGNFYTLRDIENKNFTPQAFRLLVLESHYRSESNFSWEILVSSQNRLLNWLAKSDTRWQLPENNDVAVIDKMKNALANDLNTPKVLVNIDNYFDSVEKANESPNAEVLNAIKNFIGIDLFREDVTDDIKNLLKERATAREDKDWVKTDEIRDKLKNLNIVVKDSSVGQIWQRI